MPKNTSNAQFGQVLSEIWPSDVFWLFGAVCVQPRSVCVRPIPVCARLHASMRDPPKFDLFAYDYDCARLRLHVTISTCDDM